LKQARSCAVYAHKNHHVPFLQAPQFPPLPPLPLLPLLPLLLPPPLPALDEDALEEAPVAPAPPAWGSLTHDEDPASKSGTTGLRFAQTPVAYSTAARDWGAA